MAENLELGAAGASAALVNDRRVIDAYIGAAASSPAASGPRLA